MTRSSIAQEVIRVTHREYSPWTICTLAATLWRGGTRKERQCRAEGQEKGSAGKGSATCKGREIQCREERQGRKMLQGKTVKERCRDGRQGSEALQGKAVPQGKTVPQGKSVPQGKACRKERQCRK